MKMKSPGSVRGNPEVDRHPSRLYRQLKISVVGPESDRYREKRIATGNRLRPGEYRENFSSYSGSSLEFPFGILKIL